MSEKNGPEHLSFSQAQGLEPLPSPLALGVLSKGLRNAIHAAIYTSMRRSTDRYVGKLIVVGEWRDMLESAHVEFHERSVNSFSSNFGVLDSEIQATWTAAPYAKAFDWLTYILRHPSCPQDLRDRIQALLVKYRAAYRIIDPGPTIVPISSPEEGQVVQAAFLSMTPDHFAGARTHLREAGMYLGAEGKERDSVRASIHAVESVCKVIARDEKATLADALRVIKVKHDLHPALASALDKLYGYSGDEGGVRHAQMGEESKLDSVTAQFMFGVCAAFITYLIGRSQVDSAG